MIFQSYGIKKTKFSLHYIIFISTILHLFRRPLKKCKIVVSLYFYLSSFWNYIYFALVLVWFMIKRTHLDQRYASEVEVIITSPLERDPYTTLKAELVTCLSPSREQRIHQFLTLEMSNCKQSQFLRQLRSLVPDVPDDFLRSIWSSRLSPPT
jgi:hypothetical protein